MRVETLLPLGKLDPGLREPDTGIHTRPWAYGPVGRALGSLFALLVTLPLALVGLVLSYPTYRFVGALASRMSKGEDAPLATLKMLGGMLFFPLTWLLVAVGVYILADTLTDVQ